MSPRFRHGNQQTPIRHFWQGQSRMATKIPLFTVWRRACGSNESAHSADPTTKGTGESGGINLQPSPGNTAWFAAGRHKLHRQPGAGLPP